MVDRNIFNKLGLSQEELDQQVNEMFSEKEGEYLEEVLKTKVDAHLPGTILKGTIVSQIGNDVIVEIGLKSEGVIDASEFDDPDEIEKGKEVKVFLEDADSGGGLILLSKRKADRIKGWETIINTKKEGDVVKGKVVRRIKGGLLVDIGVPVFLPASQVDIRKPGDISRFIGKEVECKILKIDVEGRNIVVSRRKLIEEERRSSREKLLAEIEVGQLRKGVVKNIADFGVFVDLGGLDGLLHISDLSWGRISHPSEIVELDQEIECYVISVDKENEKISLGLKQKTPSPWEEVEKNYPIGARVKGKVVNVMNYGVFIRFPDGIEGLVHISEMSWTKRLAHPSELLNAGDEVEVVVLSVNKGKQEISLGLKQMEVNPWAVASQKYPSGTVVTATVRGLTNFGAFVEIEEGIDGMIHISDLSWTRKYNHPSEALQKGQEVKCVVLEVDEEKRRMSIGMKQLTEDPWARAIPEKYIPGQIIKGKVTKLTNFGAFVELEPDLEGLLHISELADHKIDKPSDVVKKDDEIEVKILKVESESRKIGLSLRRAQWAAAEQAAESTQQEDSTEAVAAEAGISDVDTDEATKPQDKAEKQIGEDVEPQGKSEEQQATEEAKPQEKAEEQQAAVEAKPQEKAEERQAGEEAKPQEQAEEKQTEEEVKPKEKAEEEQGDEKKKTRKKASKKKDTEEVKPRKKVSKRSKRKKSDESIDAEKQGDDDSSSEEEAATDTDN